MSKIIITDDFNEAIKEIEYNEIIKTDELKVEDVKIIRNLAYIAQKNKYTILIAAKKYSLVSQNALLKLLEEPPKNIEFILLAKSKYSLLDTIKSRLFIETKIYNKTPECEIDIKNITNDKILELLKDDLNIEEIKALIYKILKEKELNEEELKILTDAIKMLELNIDKKAILALIMLAIKERK